MRKPNRRTWILLTSITLLLIIGVGFYLWKGRSHSGPVSVSRDHRPQLRGQAGQNYTKPIQSQGKRYRVEGGISIQLQPQSPQKSEK